MQPHHAKSYRHIREVVLWLHAFICHNCKCKALNCETHHRDNNNKNNSIFNIVPLCPSCHILFRKLPNQQPISVKEIIVLLLKKITYFSSLKN